MYKFIRVAIIISFLMIYALAYIDQEVNVISPVFSKTAPYADIPPQGEPNWGVSIENSYRQDTTTG